MNRLLIKNARLVGEGREFDADLRVRGDRIEQIGSNLPAGDAEFVHDAAGKWLLPGLIDIQSAWATLDIASEGGLAEASASAVAAGVTSLVDPRPARPSSLDDESLQAWLGQAQAQVRANFGFGWDAHFGPVAPPSPRPAPGAKDMPALVQHHAHTPAERFGIVGRGYLREGYFADLVLVDGQAPFDGGKLGVAAMATFVNGEMCWNGQQLLGAAQGRRLGFMR